ncbi:HetP family heterocyst commitment protein [filamentous cyanobacterium LEGE 11480]|uniref:HetP family heterocyst commitment protein n=1 Tax=Romeriopsis navalis LEGE 11480 TaxID=2777977 RepID=A0A928VUD9_9CYAN|nr:HetP family heterocyst commitment protein [Romeriopsis navalis]MBE9033251.1 HetP family heterocyst commitment protein [Romeriopsis navalis LEGE 11480]
MQNPISKLNAESSRLDQVMEPDQFNQVIEAILSGKYSWACVLILKFAGYNPLHYIPYRTYNRIMKDNKRKMSDCVKVQHQTPNRTSKSPTVSVQDLNYSKSLNPSQQQVSGGKSVWLYYVEQH